MSTFRIEGNNGTTVRIQTPSKKVFRVEGTLRGPKGPPGAPGDDGVDGANGRDIELQNNGTYVQWRYVGDDVWLDLVDISTLAGADGADGTNGQDGVDGREVELQSNGISIQWRYVGDAAWTDLVSIASLKGADGAPGDDGADGYTPIKGVDYFDGQDGTDGTNGVDGTDGREVELQKNATHIQWRYVGDVAWLNLVALADLEGADGADGVNGVDGADGRTTLSGAGAPSNGLGQDGDFYINTTTYGIYGPKTGGVWGSSTSLIGPAGSGTGDMLSSVYDPAGGARQVAFQDELGGGGVTDHGDLTGLADDDHTQYALADGSRGSFATTSQGAKADTAVQPAAIADFETSTELNVRDTANRSRANHTGSQTASTISDFDTEVSNNTDVAANTAARHTHSNSAVLNATTASFTTADETKLDGIEAGADVTDSANVQASLPSGTNGQVLKHNGTSWAPGVDNNTTYTVPTQAEAEAGTATTARAFSAQRVNQAIQALAPVKTVDLAAKANAADLTSHTGNTSNPHSVTKAQVGLGNVDNTSDASKPISTAAQTALDTKLEQSDLARTPNRYVEGVDLYLIGHSFTMLPYPYTHNPFSTEYGVRVRDRLNMGDYHWHGRSGTPAEAMIGRIMSPLYDKGSGAWTPNSKGVVMIENYMNELSTTRDTLYRNLWAQSIRGEIAVASSKNFFGVADATGTSGTWTEGTSGGGRDTKGLKGRTFFTAHNSGAYKEFVVSGDEAWVVATVGLSSYNIANFKVSCNGIDVATFAGHQKKPDYTDVILDYNAEYTPWLVRVTGLNAAAGTTGAKTIRITPVASQGNFFFSGVIEPSPTPPRVFLAKEPERGYPAIAAWTDQHEWFEGMIDTIASEFTNVHVVDLLPGWDGSMMISSMDAHSPAIHPNDVGMEHIATKFVESINTNITTFDPGVVQI